MVCQPKKSQLDLNPIFTVRLFLSQISIKNKNYINNKDRNCTLSNPEKVNNSCLDFEDAKDWLRLKADAIEAPRITYWQHLRPLQAVLFCP